MNIVRLFVGVYCLLSCIACPIHMWRNRKEREVVEIYFLTFLICLLAAVALLVT